MKNIVPVFMLVFVFACSGLQEDNPASSSLSKVVSNSGVFGPAGGTLLVQDDYGLYGKLVFPSGALSQSTTITMVYDTDKLEATLTPDGTQFQENVELNLAYDESQVSGPESELVIRWFNEATNDWETVPGSYVNTESNFVRVYITHFSRYAIGSE